MNEKLELPKECQGCPVAEAFKAALLEFQLDITKEKLLHLLADVEKDFCCQKAKNCREIQESDSAMKD